MILSINYYNIINENVLSYVHSYNMSELNYNISIIFVILSNFTYYHKKVFVSFAHSISTHRSITDPETVRLAFPRFNLSGNQRPGIAVFNSFAGSAEIHLN